jgi:hypothetical protein
MKAHQRIIREQHTLVLPHSVPESLRDARVEEIDYTTAKKVIEQYEWLGTMVEDGFLFLTGTPKRRYVTFCADRRLERELRSALRWKVLPYPRRA